MNVCVHRPNLEIIHDDGLFWLGIIASLLHHPVKCDLCGGAVHTHHHISIEGQPVKLPAQTVCRTCIEKIADHLKRIEIPKMISQSHTCSGCDYVFYRGDISLARHIFHFELSKEMILTCMVCCDTCLVKGGLTQDDLEDPPDT